MGDADSPDPHVITLVVSLDDLRRLVGILEAALPCLRPYQARIKKFGSRISASQTEVHALWHSMVDAPINEIQRLSRQIFELPPGWSPQVGVDAIPGPGIAGTPREEPLKTSLRDLVGWLYSMRLTPREVKGHWPIIDSTRAKVFQHIIGELKGLSGDGTIPPKRARKPKAEPPTKTSQRNAYIVAKAKDNVPIWKIVEDIAKRPEWRAIGVSHATKIAHRAMGKRTPGPKTP
jgi:hypothetical protein